MAQLMLDHGLAACGRFIVIAPRLNRRAAATSAIYKAELLPHTDDTPADGRQRIAFEHITLATIIHALVEHGDADYAAQLWARYADFHRVIRCVLNEIVSVAPGAVFARERKPAHPASAVV
jgi:hypothetical protein